MPPAYDPHTRSPKYAPYIRGGDGDKDGGCRDTAGGMRGHYWVEVTLADGTCGVADITADQFGHPPIRWLPLPGAATLQQPGRQNLVDASVRDVDDEIAIS